MQNINAFPDLIDRYLTPFENVVVVASMAAIVTLVSVQVVLRYGFNSSLHWAEELVRYTVVWMSFLAAGMGVKRGAHIAVELLRSLLPTSLSRWVLRLACLAGIAFAVILFWAGLAHVLKVGGFGQVSSAMRAPMWLVYTCIPFGALLLGLRFLEQFWVSFRPVAANETELDWRGGL